MLRSTLRAVPALLVVAALAVTPHAAVSQTIMLSGNGTVTQGFSTLVAGQDFSFSFTLPQSPTPSSFFSPAFTLLATGAFTQGALTTNFGGGLTFFSTGGFNFNASGIGPVVSIFGPVLFSGPVDAPTFTAGTTTQFTNGNVPTRLTSVTIGPVAPTSTVPEPSTLALLGTGLLAVGGVAARRKRTA
jgi:hypothetical protein